MELDSKDGIETSKPASKKEERGERERKTDRMGQ